MPGSKTDKRRRIPRTLYAVVCVENVDNSLFDYAAAITRTLKQARTERCYLNRECCDGGHHILKLTAEIVQ